ncbi:MAG TPA: NAD(+) synthase [Lentisphaeria bacterium]|nr:MAG: NAD(+) synthase [Lentisphaerae bacterium GWF2_38_69]HBM17592.1 NAD(+) synthase [Lentisphaeria bacterium]
MFGFYRVGSCVPELKVADTDFNASETLKMIALAEKEHSSLIVFPELNLTSYTCGDLFQQSSLYQSLQESLNIILKESKEFNILSILGLPVQFGNLLYNCALVIHKGKILGVVPKTYIPNYKEFYEKRWFSQAYTLVNNQEIEMAGQLVPFGSNIIFEYGEDFKLAIEICEDLWSPVPPSSFHAVAGANIIVNLSASNELVGKADYRRSLVLGQSAKCIASYIYSSSGVGESSSDVLFGGHAMIAENGALLEENKRFNLVSEIIYADLDCQKLDAVRKSETSFYDTMQNIERFTDKLRTYRRVKIPVLNRILKLRKKVNAYPFVPADDESKTKRCNEIFSIQSSALARRLEHTKAKKSVIGISGGLDSTLALLVVKASHEKINKPLSDIVAITMPGFGTTGRTYNNSLEMCRIMGCDLRIKDIKEVCSEQFKLLDFNPENMNTTYENVQARQRTMILMDTANETGGIVIGTGDLSEIALGWSTYNGDHMSMYNVNCGVPKSLIRYLIGWYASESEDKLRTILEDIINTPVSPELLPPDKAGKISQMTEDIIGPYELHDFFLYHFIKYGASPKKILFLAVNAFEGKYDEAFIKKYLKLFISRFFSQQFKRNCMPDGPKVGTISLSPRGDWRMPPDASSAPWSNQLP